MKKIAINGIPWAALDRGEGMPLLLVHGFPLDHTMWDAQIASLSARYRIIAPDLRGFGQSEPSDGAVSMQDFADDLAALLGELGVEEPVVLCGLSMGGYVALEFWRRHRRRLRGLVLCDTRAVPDTPEAAAARLATADRVLREGPEFLAESMLPKLFATANQQPEPEYVTATRRVILATDPRGIAAAARGMAQRRDFAPLLPQVDVPTLVLVGEQDAISTPHEMRGMAQAIPAARYVEIEGAGHMAPLEKPAEVTAAIVGSLTEVSGS